MTTPSSSTLSSNGSAGPAARMGLATAGVDRAAERALRQEIREAVGRLLDERQLLAPGPEDELRIRALIQERIAAHQRRAATTNAPQLADPEGVARRVFDGLLRLGPLQPLMDNASVEEVIVNGPRVFAIAGGRKRLVPDLYFEDDEELRQLVKRLIGPLGRRLDESSPMVDARLPDGSRLNAAIPPATTRFTSVTIRKFVLRAQSLEQLVELGTLPRAAADFLDAAVQAGVNIVVSGSTGSGKCVTGDTLVTLADGSLTPIRELVERSFAENGPTFGRDGWISAPLGDKVLTCDFDRGTIEPASGVTAWRHPAPRELLEVTTRSGETVRVTPEHPFFTLVDGEMQEVRADHLRPGGHVGVATQVQTGGHVPDVLDLLADCDRLYVVGAASLMQRAFELIKRREGHATLRDTYHALGLPASARFWRSVNAVPVSQLLRLLARAELPTSELGDTLTVKTRTRPVGVTLPRLVAERLARLAGLVAGDGHLGQAAVELTSGDPGVREDFARLARELFGAAVAYRPSPGRCPTLLLHSTAVRELLTALFGIPRGAKARSIRAPRWLFSAPRELIAAYLSGLLDTDGSVLPRTATGSPLVAFVTTSSGLATDIVALLLRLGVRSHLRKRPGCHLVQVYDPGAIQRLKQTLVLAHTRRKQALASVVPGYGYSAVDVIPTLAAPLRQARLAAGMSQAQAAVALGVSESMAYLYESGARRPTRARVFEFARRTSDPALAARLHGLAAQPVFWDRVTSIRRLAEHGEHYVYDLTVPGTHTFLVGAAGVIAHNTTVLNALGASIASLDERVVTIEEVPELTLDRQLPDCVALQARAGNVEGAGEIRIRDLVKNALRMRPTRIVVGECRGGEALDMLLAMNTGHDGSLTTVHGNSPRDALTRLRTLAMMAEERLSGEAVTEMIASSIELVVQMRVEPRTGRRRVVHVFEVTGLEGNVLTGQDLWLLDAGRDRLVWTGFQPRCVATRIAPKGIPYALPAVPARPGEEGLA